HIQLITFELPNQDFLRTLKDLNINSLTQYNWGGKQLQDYIKWASKAAEVRDLWDKHLSIPFYPNVSIGWDDTPRFPHKGEKDIIRYNKSPESFAAFLEEAKTYCRQHPEQENLITIFSWNEWVEGGYLLPDRKYGFEYLEKVKEVMKHDYNPYQE
ncbi:MAG: glycoside hydrolase family 99-like domain-containing protein, partial [Allomuricauda sp.]